MRGLDFFRSRAAQLGVGVLTAVAAATFRFWLTPFFADRNQLVMFYPAIMVSAWWGGFWPGVVATVVSATLDAYLFLEPLFTLRLTHHGDKLALAIFVGTGVVISVLNENLRRNAVRECAARAQAEQARAEADAANRAKDFFLAAVSHDLRTPMNATLGWAHMLSKNILDPVQSDRAIDAIRRSVERQLVLVNDLLDTAAILSGRLRVERARVDVADVVGAAIEIAEPLAQAKRVNMRADSRRPGPTVVGDASRLQQVISNLLTNAIKFTPTGGTVQVQVCRAGPTAEIKVSDTGQGIPSNALPFVFNQFWQADHSATRSNTGVGLGLAIAKHLVNAHGGSIDVASEGEGLGCMFTVRLPLVGMPTSRQLVARETSRA